MSVPGIGPIISSAIVAAIGAGDAFAKGRDFAAWLGLVPKQFSTGDRTVLGKISKRGNRYLRALFVQAAWVVLIKPKSWERHGLKPWIEAARRRLHHNVLAIALANKLARVAWSVLAHGRDFEARKIAEAAAQPADRSTHDKEPALTSPQLDENLLRRTAGPCIRVRLGPGRSADECPVSPRLRTIAGRPRRSRKCHKQTTSKGQP
jgi:Transposase IS116/IS110/IS902 family